MAKGLTVNMNVLTRCYCFCSGYLSTYDVYFQETKTGSNFERAFLGSYLRTSLM